MRLLLSLAVVLAAVPSSASAQKFAPNVVTAKPLDPAAERAAFKLPPGFEAQLVAADPDTLATLPPPRSGGRIVAPSWLATCPAILDYARQAHIPPRHRRIHLPARGATRSVEGEEVAALIRGMVHRIPSGKSQRRFNRERGGAPWPLASRAWRTGAKPVEFARIVGREDSARDGAR